ncbi:hypothetical protein GOODEAATRI_008389 [Goodea atripinnis]|uniref:Uncharacterized protein n=1 Tax=Goodea atripinnis TaxID=208336 RepID=A0ABV0PCE9_9TELE
MFPFHMRGNHEVPKASVLVRILFSFGKMFWCFKRWHQKHQKDDHEYDHKQNIFFKNILCKISTARKDITLGVKLYIDELNTELNIVMRLTQKGKSASSKFEASTKQINYTFRGSSFP